jgi:tRNA-splicing ligase RtcB
MIFGNHESKTIEQYEHIKNNAVRAALMADGHYGYVMPVGGVAAYDNQVSVNGVGFDIACGNCAIKTNLTLEHMIGASVFDIESNPHKISSNPILNQIADEIAGTISFGLGRKNKANDAPVEHPLFQDPAWHVIPNIGGYRDELKEKARRQLGTVGSGNHYVDVFVDREDGHIWVGVHFGSRGFGHTIASNFLAIGQGGSWGDRAKEIETMLALGTATGDDYWALMELAGQYAYAGREWVARSIVEILQAGELDLVHNHHNFAWKEKHNMDGATKELIVVRKGATPAFPGQRGFVGGSMGDDAVILQGVEGNPAIQKMQEQALYSTVHGAGRVMSRTEASGKRDFKTGRLMKDKRTGNIIKPGKISPEMMQSWIKAKGVVLRGGGLDESPHVYRRLPDVLAAQGPTVKVLNTLRPLIVVMAGEHEVDPYKD